MRKGKRLALFLRDMSDLSRRDERTEPGVLTPGTDKRTIRPEGAVGIDRYMPSKNEMWSGLSTALSGRVRDVDGPGVKTPGLVLVPLRGRLSANRSLRLTN